MPGNRVPGLKGLPVPIERPPELTSNQFKIPDPVPIATIPIDTFSQKNCAKAFGGGRQHNVAGNSIL